MSTPIPPVAADSPPMPGGAARRVPDALRRRAWWGAAGIIVVSGGLLGLALNVLQTQALQAGERLSQSLAQVIEEQTSRTLQATDQGLQLAASRMELLVTHGRADEDAARRLLRAQLEELPFISDLWILDGQGRTVHDSHPGTIGKDFSDREYFRIYRARPQTQFHVAAPVLSRVTGKWMINAARPLRSADGAFAGVVVAALDPDHFDRIWNTIDLGSDGSVMLLRRDRVPMLRSPAIESVMGKPVADHRLFRELLPEASRGSFQGASLVGDACRVFGYRVLSAQPELVVVVGQSYERVLLPWRRFAGTALAFWLALSVAAVVLANLLVGSGRRRRRAEAAVLEGEARYHSIFDTSLDAILLTAPDGKIIEVNSAACEMFRTTAEELIRGRRWAVVDVSDPRLRPALAERQRSGRFRGELTFLRKGGEKFPGEVSSSVFTDKDGSIRTSMVIRDVTERTRTEARLRDNALQLRALSRRVLATQEAERRRVAIELHDELGQALTAIRINLQAQAQAQARATGGSEGGFTADNLRIVDDALHQVRRLAAALRPSILDDLGLIPALRWLAEQSAARGDLVVEFRTTAQDTRLAPEVETACFRIVQEALTNVVRHARATRVQIELHFAGELLVLSVQDDGCGCDPAAMSASAVAGGSVGLLGMRERAALIGGQLEVESSPGHGCTVRLRCPAPRRGDVA